MVWFDIKFFKVFSRARTDASITLSVAPASISKGLVIQPMVIKGPEGSFDPGFVADAGIVLIDLQDQVGFMAGFKDLFKVFDDE